VDEYEYYPETEVIVDNGDGSWSYQPKHLQTDNNVKEERRYD
jgi:hypothetical protein